MGVCQEFVGNKLLGGLFVNCIYSRGNIYCIAGINMLFFVSLLLLVHTGKIVQNLFIVKMCSSLASPK